VASKWFMFKVKLVKLLVSDKTLAEQARKPSGWLGRHILQPMFISGNAALNNLLDELLAVQPNQKALEIGFGPGVLLNQLCHSVPSASLTGLDFSPTMVKEAALLNKSLIESGQLQLLEGCSDAMPFSNAEFDSVFCANTLYFWQPPEPHLNEIFRVLKSGGKFVMGFRTGQQIDEMELHATIFARYSEEDVVKLLQSVGFEAVEIQQREGFPVESYCVVAYRP